MLDNQCQPKLVEINARPAALNDKEKMLYFIKLETKSVIPKK